MNASFIRRASALATALFFILIVGTVAAASHTYTNSTAAQVDASSVDRTVTVGNADFDSSATISDVNVSITFRRPTNNCNANNTGDPDNIEIYFGLRSPAGTVVDLIPYVTYYGQQDAVAAVTVNLDDGAGVRVGGLGPVSGTFYPANPLSTFNGESPFGNWSLIIADNSGNDHTCFISYTLELVAAGTTTVVTKAEPVNPDVDEDGVPSDLDNCINEFNPGQEDGWGSAMGDSCDTDWYNRSSVEVEGFVQKDGTFHLHGNCVFFADGASSCPVIADFDPATFVPSDAPIEISTPEANGWSVWLYYLHSNNGADVYQVNTYRTATPQPDSLVDDKLEIHVSGGVWQWYQRGGDPLYHGI